MKLVESEVIEGETEVIDMTPVTSFLNSYQNTKPNYRILCGEAVDNAFDALATKVELTFSKSSIVIKDNGIGIDRKRQESLWRLGLHGNMDSTKLGQYGIGIKEQALVAGDEFTVKSQSADGYMFISFDWSSILNSNSWKKTVPKIRQNIISVLNTFTEITISQLRHAPNKFPIEKITSELERMFQPALISGKRIVLNGKEIMPIEDPELIKETIIEATIPIRGEKHATIRAGILKDPDNAKLTQVHISYEHRVILPQDLFGCGDGRGASLMFARITLYGGKDEEYRWRFGKNKTEITDSDNNYLEEQVEILLEPLLAKCKEDHFAALINEATIAINDLLPSEFRPNRPIHKSNEPPKKGKKLGKKNNNLCFNGNNSATGPTQNTKRTPKIFLQLIPNLKDARGENSAGMISRNRQMTVVQIRSDIYSIKELMDKKAWTAIYHIGLQIFAEGVHPEGEFDFGDFGSRVYSLLKMQKFFAKEEVA